MDGSLGFAHFLAQTDAVGKSVLAILVAMSIATWYLILVKALEGLLQRRAAARFHDFFWNAPSLAAVADHLVARPLAIPSRDSPSAASRPSRTFARMAASDSRTRVTFPTSSPARCAARSTRRRRAWSAG